MLVAKSEKLERIFIGPEVRPQFRSNGSDPISENIYCPDCGEEVTYNHSPTSWPFGFFHHSDGSPDCFETESTSDEHRLMIELTMKSLHNYVNEVTGERVDINVEKRVGTPENFVTADVRVTSPVKIVAETFYKVSDLALGRRFRKYFDNGYQMYLIFHQHGKHDVDRVEEYLQQVAPVQVGRFNPETLELTLGDLFTDNQFVFSDREKSLLPDYIVPYYD